MGLDWTNRISFREYSICCIRKIWVDWPGTGLPIFPNSVLGPTSWAFVWAAMEGHGHGAEPIALLGWRVGYLAYFSIPISCPPVLVYGLRGQGL